MTTTTPHETSAVAGSSEQVIERLRVDIACGVDFATQLKEAHWNIVGPNFIALHELFDRQTAEMRLHVDALAERMRQLGEVPAGTVRQAAAHSTLDDFPAQVLDEQAVVETLVTRYEQFGERLRHSAKNAEEAGDYATHDLYVELLRATNLQAWFLRSHLPAGT